MYTETANMTAHQMATADRPAGSVDDAELLALGKEFAPLFERWNRQVAVLRDGISIPTREKATSSMTASIGARRA
jgi:hypothetical protein